MPEQKIWEIFEQRILEILECRRDRLQGEMMAAKKEYEICRSAYLKAKKDIVEHKAAPKNPPVKEG